MEFLYGKMEKNTEDIGKMGNKKDMVNIKMMMV